MLLQAAVDVRRRAAAEAATAVPFLRYRPSGLFRKFLPSRVWIEVEAEVVVEIGDDFGEEPDEGKRLPAAGRTRKRQSVLAASEPGEPRPEVHRLVSRSRDGSPEP